MQKKLTILLIEDDQIEIMKFNRILTKIDSEHEIIEANNGEDALNILSNKEALPSLILLDLNMPKVNGIEFLKILKNGEALKYIPTVILTTSNNYKDMLECYKIGIAGYMVKPLKYEDYKNKLIKVLSYWSVNELISV